MSRGDGLTTGQRGHFQRSGERDAETGSQRAWIRVAPIPAIESRSRWRHPVPNPKSEIRNPQWT
jgi:hypothetical protein